MRPASDSSASPWWGKRRRSDRIAPCRPARRGRRWPPGLRGAHGPDRAAGLRPGVPGQGRSAAPTPLAPADPDAFYADMLAHDPIDYVARISPTPVLFVQGDADAFVSLDTAGRSSRQRPSRRNSSSSPAPGTCSAGPARRGGADRLARRGVAHRLTLRYDPARGSQPTSLVREWRRPPWVGRCWPWPLVADRSSSEQDALSGVGTILVSVQRRCLIGTGSELDAGTAVARRNSGRNARGNIRPHPGLRDVHALLPLRSRTKTSASPRIRVIIGKTVATVEGLPRKPAKSQIPCSSIAKIREPVSRLVRYRIVPPPKARTTWRAAPGRRRTPSWAGASVRTAGWTGTTPRAR